MKGPKHQEDQERGGAAGPTCPPPPRPPRASPCLQHLPLQPICSVPSGTSGRLTHHGLHPLLQMPRAFPQVPQQDPWKPTSLPLICGPSHSTSLGGPQAAWVQNSLKAFNSHCGPGLLKAGPHIRISGYQKPMPTGSPDPIRGPARGPWAWPRHPDQCWRVIPGGPCPLPLWLVAL